jgi:CHAT domain-containing protein
LGNTNLFVFGIGEEKFLWKKIPASEIPIEAMNQWIADLVQVPSGSRYELHPEISRLGGAIFGHFDQEIGDAKELVLIPQGILNSVPFELLPDGKGNFLFEQVPVIYQFSAQFVHSIANGPNPRSGLGLAPFTESENISGFAPLPQSAIELEAFAGEKLSGKAAVKSAFLDKAGNSEVIHLATHAVASSTDPDQAFIAFYPEGEDFRLFAPELAFQSLEKAKLVFLSACETGAGQLSKSEGLISLARSLAFAGAEQMIITQWISEDRVAAFISEKFYQHVSEGMTYAAALHRAKLDLLEDSQMAQYRHPFYWANFRLIGQPTQSNLVEPWMIWLGLLLFLMPLAIWTGAKLWNRQ